MMWFFDILPGRIARRLRRQLADLLLGHLGIETIPIRRSHAGGVIDGVEMSDDGTLSVVGWAPDATVYAEPMRLKAFETSISASHVFRVARPDLARLTGHHPERMGIIVEFVLPPQWSSVAATLTLAGTDVATIRLPKFSQPAYSELYGNPGVWHRDDVYGVGPPAKQVSSEILGLCGDLEGPLLDFGCGAGSLVAALRSRNVDARGLELDVPYIRDAAISEVRSHLTYYSGELPAPFGDGEFRTVTCCEVLEHIPHFERAVTELSRLATERLLITVPDMSGIPRGFHHGVVPWHLLERSHVNFFTQQSLDAVLRTNFRDVQVFRIGEVRCDRMRSYTSLVAVCTK